SVRSVAQALQITVPPAASAGRSVARARISATLSSPSAARSRTRSAPPWPGRGCAAERGTGCRRSATHPRPGQGGADRVLLRAADGELNVAEILARATDRLADAAGGTVICNACATDLTE